MIVFATFFLLALMVSICAVWTYRLISNWKGFNRLTAGRPGRATSGWLWVQQTFNPAASSTRGNARYIRNLNSRREIKAPWGW